MAQPRVVRVADSLITAGSEEEIHFQVRADAVTIVELVVTSEVDPGFAPLHVSIRFLARAPSNRDCCRDVKLRTGGPWIEITSTIVAKHGVELDIAGQTPTIVVPEVDIHEVIIVEGEPLNPR